MVAEAVVIKIQPVVLYESARAEILVAGGIEHSARPGWPVDRGVEVPASTADPRARLSWHRRHRRPVDVVPAYRGRGVVGSGLAARSARSGQAGQSGAKPGHAFASPEQPDRH